MIHGLSLLLVIGVFAFSTYARNNVRAFISMNANNPSTDWAYKIPLSDFTWQNSAPPSLVKEEFQPFIQTNEDKVEHVDEIVAILLRVAQQNRSVTFYSQKHMVRQLNEWTSSELQGDLIVLPVIEQSPETFVNSPQEFSSLIKRLRDLQREGVQFYPKPEQVLAEGYKGSMMQHIYSNEPNLTTQTELIVGNEMEWLQLQNDFTGSVILKREFSAASAHILRVDNITETHYDEVSPVLTKSNVAGGRWLVQQMVPDVDHNGEYRVVLVDGKAQIFHTTPLVEQIYEDSPQGERLSFLARSIVAFLSRDPEYRHFQGCARVDFFKVSENDFIVNEVQGLVASTLFVKYLESNAKRDNRLSDLAKVIIDQFNPDEL